MNSQAFDRSSTAVAPDSAVLGLSWQGSGRPPSDQGSSGDEDAAPVGAGRTGSLLVGTGALHQYCDGQSLASPGRWPPSRRRYPTHPEWNLVSSLFKKFTESYGSPNRTALDAQSLALRSSKLTLRRFLQNKRRALCIGFNVCGIGAQIRHHRWTRTIWTTHEKFLEGLA